MQYLREERVREIFALIGEEFVPGVYVYYPRTGDLYREGNPNPIAHQSYGGKGNWVWTGYEQPEKDE